MNGNDRKQLALQEVQFYRQVALAELRLYRAAQAAVVSGDWTTRRSQDQAQLAHAALRAAAIVYATLPASLPDPRESLLRSCEECGAPAVHAEHFHQRVRGWCDTHTPWSGHYECCDDHCAELCVAPSS